MTEHFHTNLQTALAHIGKQTWATPLAALERNFRLIPEDDVSFADALIEAIWSLSDAHKADSDLPIKHVFAIRFAKLDAWTYRFSKQTSAGKDFINPLVAEPHDFTHAEVSQSGSAFPAEDIIKRWVRDHLL